MKNSLRIVIITDRNDPHRKGYFYKCKYQEFKIEFNIKRALRKDQKYKINCFWTLTGTLVNNENQISTLTSDLVKLKKENILFSFVSQRVHFLLLFRFMKELDVQIPYISLNGALIQDYKSGNVLNKSVIDKNM